MGKRIDSLIAADAENASVTLDNLRRFDARLPDLLEETAQLFITFGRLDLRSEEKKADRDMSDAATKAGLVVPAFMALLQDAKRHSMPIRRGRTIRRRLLAGRAKLIISGLVEREYLLAALDLLRARVTSAFAHIRLQVESVALLTVFAEHPVIAELWLFSEPREGEPDQFFRSSRRLVRRALVAENLKTMYDRASRLARHPRLGTVAYGWSAAQTNERDFLTVGFVEFDAATPEIYVDHFLWLLRLQSRVLRACLFAFPSAYDLSFITRLDLLERSIDGLYRSFASTFPEFTHNALSQRFKTEMGS